MKIIIPSAKVVPQELQKLGKLPAIVYPVNQRIVFDYLREQYAGHDFTIICYENSEIVHSRLSKYKDISFVDLDKLGDLGYSIYNGIKNMSGEAVINFSDTIVQDDIIAADNDSFFYSEDEVSNIWTFFEERNGIIESIIDKKDVSDGNIAYGKLFVGVFKFTHIEYFCECIRCALDNQLRMMNSFYQALMTYSKKYPLIPIKTKNWFDVGHVDNYVNSQLEVKARSFNHIRIDKNRGMLTKTSDAVDKFIGEIKWYLKLPADIEYIRPRIFDYDISYPSPYVTMEYYAYHTLHELFLYGDLTRKQWIDIFSRIQFVCNDLKRYVLADETIPLALKDMYLTKTLHRLRQIKEDKRFYNFFNKGITVNCVRYKSLSEISESLEVIVPKLLYDVKQFNIIHGDMCFSNIMVDNNFSFIKVIDPRGKFGKYDIYGDPRYEVAKLLHSVDGKYDFIIKDLFDVNFDTETCRIDFTISDRKRDYDLYKLFLESFQTIIGDDLKKIELIEALLFLSMVPLHSESINHQMVMLATGLDILNRVVDIKEKGA